MVTNKEENNIIRDMDIQMIYSVLNFILINIYGDYKKYLYIYG